MARAAQLLNSLGSHVCHQKRETFSKKIINNYGMVSKLLFVCTYLAGKETPSRSVVPLEILCQYS